MFDEQVETIFDSIDVMPNGSDELAGTTIRSISRISQLQTISRMTTAILVPAEEMVRRLMEDDAHMAKMIREADSRL